VGGEAGWKEPTWTRTAFQRFLLAAEISPTPRLLRRLLSLLTWRISLLPRAGTCSGDVFMGWGFEVCVCVVGGGRVGGTNSHECAARALPSQVPQNVVSAVLLSIATVARLLSSPNLLMSPRETYFLPRNAKDAPRGSHRRRCSSRGRSLSRRRAKVHFAVSSSAERSLQPYFPYAHIILRTRRFSACRRPTALSYLKTHRDTEDSREGPAEDREDHASYGSGRN